MPPDRPPRRRSIGCSTGGTGIGISLDQAAGVASMASRSEPDLFNLGGRFRRNDFSLLTAGLIFPEGAGLFRETLSAAARFYWICSP